MFLELKNFSIPPLMVPMTKLIVIFIFLSLSSPKAIVWSQKVFQAKYTTSPQPIRRVAIIGGGPAGLCLAACLRKLTNPQVKCVVFERRDDPLQTSLGGGLQITGGSVVLEKLGLLPELKKFAQPLSGVLARNSHGDELLKLNLDAAVRDKARKSLCDKDSGEPMLYSITREALQKILFDAAIGDDDIVKVIPNKRFLRIENDKEGPNSELLMTTTSRTGITLAFADGSQYDNFDMVIGADGVNSGVRSFASLDQPLLQLPSFLSKGFKKYTGIRITYGLTGVDNSFSVRPDGAKIFHQWFGDGCYCLSSSYGGLQGVQHMLAFVYRDNVEGKLGENPSWESEKDIKRNLESRIKAGFSRGNTDIFRLLNACEDNRFVDLSVVDRIVPLRQWSSHDGKVVLIGDSAHAMAPFLGQGANQALQDAFVLASEIQTSNLKERGTRECAQNYERKRKFVTATLSLKANFLGALETLPGMIGGSIRDTFFRFVGKVGIAEFIFLDGAKPRI